MVLYSDFNTQVLYLPNLQMIIECVPIISYHTLLFPSNCKGWLPMNNLSFDEKKYVHINIKILYIGSLKKLFNSFLLYFQHKKKSLLYALFVKRMKRVFVNCSKNAIYLKNFRVVLKNGFLNSVKF